MNVVYTADLAQEILKDNTSMFPDWAAFKSWFLSEFMHSDEAQHMALTLESTSYHQQVCTLNIYVDRFKQLV